jgi:hypothetical protein
MPLEREPTRSGRSLTRPERAYSGRGGARGRVALDELLREALHDGTAKLADHSAKPELARTPLALYEETSAELRVEAQ